METVNDLLRVFEPLISFLVMTVGPPLVAFLAYKINTFLNIKGEAEKAEFEAKLAAAIHQSAANGLRYAANRLGAGALLGPSGKLTDAALTQAMIYVNQKNPESLKKLGVSERDLIDIITTKVGRVAAELTDSK